MKRESQIAILNRIAELRTGKPNRYFLDAFGVRLFYRPTVATPVEGESTKPINRSVEQMIHVELSRLDAILRASCAPANQETDR